MECPNCGQQNAADARFCLRCGTALTPDAAEEREERQTPAPAAVATPEPEAAPEAEAESARTEQAPARTEAPASGYTLSHRGSVFGLGFGEDFYGVWDLRVGGDPVARFERTVIGWEAAWRRFQELDGKHRVAAWRRPNVGLILLHIVIGLIVLGFLQGFVVGGFVAAIGRSLEPISETMALGLTLATFTGLTGWLLFVYLNRSTAARTLWFLLFLLGGLGAALALALANQPPA